jgi:hypothetical protein
MLEQDRSSKSTTVRPELDDERRRYYRIVPVKRSRAQRRVAR